MYNFKKNSNHVKFFKWIWGVNPYTKYKTMCPYFWSYVLTILFIIPILIVKFIIAGIINPIFKYLDIIIEKAANNRVERFMQQYNNCKSLEDYFNLYNTKCYTSNRKNLSWDIKDNMFDKYSEYDKIVKKQKQKEQQIKYNKVPSKIEQITNKVLPYILGSILVILVGTFIYWVLHLFTWEQFIYVAYRILLLVILLSILFVIGSIIVIIFKFITNKWFCNSKLQKIVFWKHIGNGLFKIVEFIAIIIQNIWKGLLIFFNMVKNTYKKQCPIIYWED